MTPGFHHAGVTVSSLRASLAFYQGVLGLEVVSTRRITEPYLMEVLGVNATSVTVTFLSVPGSTQRVELLEYEGIERRTAAARPCDPANAHFCLTVDDLDAVFARLVEAGFKARSTRPVPIPVGPNAGGKLLYAVDPDGSYVELLERP